MNLIYSMNHVFLKSELKLLFIVQIPYTHYSGKDDLTWEK